MSRTNFGIQTNSVDPDQTAPRKQSDKVPHCLVERRFKWTNRHYSGCYLAAEELYYKYHIKPLLACSKMPHN